MTNRLPSGGNRAARNWTSGGPLQVAFSTSRRRVPELQRRVRATGWPRSCRRGIGRETDVRRGPSGRPRTWSGSTGRIPELDRRCPCSPWRGSGRRGEPGREDLLLPLERERTTAGGRLEEADQTRRTGRRRGVGRRGERERHRSDATLRLESDGLRKATSRAARTWRRRSPPGSCRSGPMSATWQRGTGLASRAPIASAVPARPKHDHRPALVAASTVIEARVLPSGGCRPARPDGVTLERDAPVPASRSRSPVETIETVLAARRQRLAVENSTADSPLALES